MYTLNGLVACEETLVTCDCGCCPAPRSTGEQYDLWFVSERKAIHVYLFLTIQLILAQTTRHAEPIGTTVKRWNQSWAAGSAGPIPKLDASDFIYGLVTYDRRWTHLDS